MVILSHYQAQEILTARTQRLSLVEVSLDLNLSQSALPILDDGCLLPDGTVVEWDALRRIADSENKCFALEADGSLSEIRVFSEDTNWVRSLYPTESAPTTLVAGLTMHRIVNTNPIADTMQKIKAARPHGRVLDTATGLGYTAIEAAKIADHVTTIEIDPAALEIARYNPWSQALFDNPKINQVIGHVWDIAEDTPDGQYSCIIHDPPAFNLAGELYAGDFYRELYRILRSRGRLFHYIGDLNSQSNRSVVPGVIRRLQDAGFQRVKKVERAFGVLAVKH